MSNQLSILIIVTSTHQLSPGKQTGLWLEEYALPYMLFTQHGYRVHVASTKGGKAPIDPRSIPNSEQQAMWSEACQALDDTIALSDIRPDEFEAVFIPGGHGTMLDFPDNQQLHRLLQNFAAQDKVIAAMCHGPASLVGVTLADGTPLVSNKRLTSFTNDEETAAGFENVIPFLLETRLRELGAHFIRDSNWANHVEVDGKLVTGQNPQSSRDTAQAVMEILSNEHNQR